MQTITTTKRRSENIKATSSKREQDHILNNLLAHSRAFHYSNISFASAGPLLPITERLHSLSKSPGQMPSKTGTRSKKRECSPLTASYSEASTARDRDAWQQRITPTLEEHPSGAAENWDLGITPPTLQRLRVSDKSEPTRWSLATDRKRSQAHHFWQVAKPDSTSL